MHWPSIGPSDFKPWVLIPHTELCQWISWSSSGMQDLYLIFLLRIELRDQERLMSEKLHMCRLTDPLFCPQVFIVILKCWISYSCRSQVSLNKCDRLRSLTRYDSPFFSCQFLPFSRRWVSRRGRLGSLLCCKLQHSAVLASAAGKCKGWAGKKLKCFVLK